MARPRSSERLAAESLAAELAGAGASPHTVKRAIAPFYHLSPRTLDRIMEGYAYNPCETLSRSIERLKRLALLAEQDGDYKAAGAIHAQIRMSTESLELMFRREAKSLQEMDF